MWHVTYLWLLLRFFYGFLAFGILFYAQVWLSSYLSYLECVELLIPTCIPDSSVGIESACNAGDPGSIPGSGRLPGAGISYPFQYSWAALVAQLVKSPSAMRETWVRSLGWDDPLEEGLPTSVFWPGEFHGLYSPWGHKQSDTTEWLSLFQTEKI